MFEKLLAENSYRPPRGDRRLIIARLRAPSHSRGHPRRLRDHGRQTDHTRLCRTHGRARVVRFRRGFRGSLSLDQQSIKHPAGCADRCSWRRHRAVDAASAAPANDSVYNGGRMTTRTTSVSFGRARLPIQLSRDLMALKPGLRGRTVALILSAKAQDVDLGKLVAAADELRRVGALINQSLRLSLGRDVDQLALARAAQLINSLRQ